MVYWLALKINELSSPDKTWSIFKCILQSERSQPEKAVCCIHSSISCIGKGKAMETVKRSVVSRSWRGG